MQQEKSEAEQSHTEIYHKLKTQRNQQGFSEASTQKESELINHTILDSEDQDPEKTPLLEFDTYVRRTCPENERLKLATKLTKARKLGGNLKKKDSDALSSFSVTSSTSSTLSLQLIGKQKLMGITEAINE